MTALVAYKVLTGEQMTRLETDGVFEGAAVDKADGYIHLSTAEQLDETVVRCSRTSTRPCRFPP
jgi:uncharacterized protein (DUF952 family)